MFSTGSHRSENKSSIIAIQTHEAPLAKSDSVFEEKLHACRTKIQQIRMNFTTKPSDHNKTFKSNPRNEAEIKTEWKKFTGKKFQITEEEIVSKSNEIQKNFFQRKMNQKQASIHDYSKKEKEKRGFWNFTFVERERERELRRGI